MEVCRSSLVTAISVPTLCNVLRNALSSPLRKTVIRKNLEQIKSVYRSYKSYVKLLLVLRKYTYMLKFIRKNLLKKY